MHADQKNPNEKDLILVTMSLLLSLTADR